MRCVRCARDTCAQVFWRRRRSKGRMKRGEGGLESASLIAGDVALDSSEHTSNTNGAQDTVLKTVAVSFWKIYWIGFLVQLEGNVVLPTIWDYVKNHFEASVIVYGAILSVQAAAETIGALILGFWSDRRPMRYPLMAMTSLFIVANIIYILAWNTNIWVILVARFIAGLGFGGQSVTLAYITHNSSAQERNHKIAMFWFTCLSTNIFGPLLTFLLIKADVGYASSDMINRVTIPSLFNIVFYAINTLVIFLQWPASASHHVSEKQAKIHLEERGFKGILSLLRTIPFLGFVFLYIKLVFSLMVSVLQAIASPITDQETSNNSLIFLVIGTVIIGGVLLTKLINRCVSDYNTLQIGQITAFISLFGLLQWPISEKENRDALFGLSSIILTIGNSIGITISTAAYSKAIGQYHPRKGTLMGWFITAAAIARIIGPILSCIGLETVGLNVIGGVLIFASLVAIVVLSFSRLRMHYLQSADTIR